VVKDECGSEESEESEEEEEGEGRQEERRRIDEEARVRLRRVPPSAARQGELMAHASVGRLRAHGRCGPSPPCTVQ